jgi:hypothetical protein
VQNCHELLTLHKNQEGFFCQTVYWWRVLVSL